MSYLIRTKYDGFSPDGRRTLNKGGGGSSGTPYYANMDRLYGAQSRAAEYMLDQSMPVLPQYMSNSNRMVTEAMDGTLANQLRQRAGNDATAAMGAALDANNRNMQRYGMGFSADRLLSDGNRNAIMGAAQKAGAMSMADLNAEDMKWNRNAGALGQATGMGTGAMQTMGQAAGGYGAAGHSMMQNDAANAAGYGQFGAALAKSAFKDGGEVQAPKRRGLRDVRLAAGGDPWSAWKAKNPITMGGPQGGGGGTSALGSVLAGAAPYVVGKGLKAALGSNVVKDAGAKLYGAVRSGLESAVGYNPTQAAAEVVDKSTNLVSGPTAMMPKAETASWAVPGVSPVTGPAINGVGGVAVDASTKVAGDIAAAGTEKAAEAAAGEAAGSAVPGVGTAIGAANDLAEGDYLKAGARIAMDSMLPGSGLVLDFIGLSNGGPVPKEGASPRGLRRKDFSEDGGRVHGPGTETSDDIPAWLSKGEYVLNAEAVKLVGKDKLDKINEAGLKKREGEEGETLEGEFKRVDDKPKRGLRLAGGGFLGGNLGIALGAGVQEFKDQQRAAREEEAFGLQKKAFGWQEQEQQAKEALRKRYEEIAAMPEGEEKELAYRNAEPGKAFERTLKAEEGKRLGRLTDSTVSHYANADKLAAERLAQEKLLAEMKDRTDRAQIAAHQAGLRAGADKIVNLLDKDGNAAPHVYDPARNTFTPLAVPPGMRYQAGAAAAPKLSDGLIAKIGEYADMPKEKSFKDYFGLEGDLARAQRLKNAIVAQHVMETGGRQPAFVTDGVPLAGDAAKQALAIAKETGNAGQPSAPKGLAAGNPQATAKAPALSDRDVDTMLKDAMRGGSAGKEWLLKNNDKLTIGQRAKIEEALGIGSLVELGMK